MKNLVILLAAVMTVSCTNTQKLKDKDVPEVVKSALQKAYPAAKEIKWEKENGNFEAGFELGETEADYSLVIDNSGNILETEIEIKAEELLAKVRDYVAKNYAGQKIKEAAKITDSKGVVTYEAELKDKDLIFDSNGNFIREMKP